MKRLLLLTAAALLLVRCADNGPATVAGNGDASEAGNAFVAGKLVTPLGEPDAAVPVTLVPVTFDPVADADCICIQADTTDSDGRYRIPVETDGLFNVLARSADRLHGVIIDSIRAFADDSVAVPDDSLRRVGCTRIGLDSTFTAGAGYLYVPGTDLVAWIDSAAIADTFAVLRDVPAGSRLRVRYRSDDGSDAPVYEHLQVSPGDTTHCPGPRCKRLPDSF